MRKSSTRNWVVRCLLISLGSSVFVLSGCDPQIQATVLSGLNTASTSLSTTFINAFFQKLQAGDTATTGTGT